MARTFAFDKIAAAARAVSRALNRSQDAKTKIKMLSDMLPWEGEIAAAIAGLSRPNARKAASALLQLRGAVTSLVLPREKNGEYRLAQVKTRRIDVVDPTDPEEIADRIDA